MLDLAYIADDFTGATDALEVLTRAGVEAELFLAPPTSEQLAARPGLRAIGLATRCRSLSPDEMQTEVRPLLTALAPLRPRYIHYKICSTADSSPTLGSVGAVIEEALAMLQPSTAVPLLVAAPNLGRWCVFGNLFARYGIGSSGEIYRLDRHPAMRVHPATPMTESDLRRHFARQSSRSIGLLDILQLAKSPEKVRATWDQVAGEASIILCDALSQNDLATLGRLFESLAAEQAPLFLVGSSGVESALSMQWSLEGRELPKITPATGPVLVVSGSCSPVTVEQIRHAERLGNFQVMSFSPSDSDSKVNVLTETTRRLRLSESVIVNSAASSSAPICAESLSAFYGDLVKQCVKQIGIRRVCFAGGDTSSHAAQLLHLESLRVRATVTPGAPLCVATAPGTALDGVELIFKGGQVGPPDFFELLR